MKQRLLRMHPRERARLVRWLERASDYLARKQATRQAVGRRLREIKAILKAHSMRRVDGRSQEWRVGLDRWRQWHPWTCHCGNRGSVLIEIQAGVLEFHVIDVEGSPGLTSEGKVICLCCARSCCPRYAPPSVPDRR